MGQQELLGNIESALRVFMWLPVGKENGVYIQVSAHEAQKLVFFLYREGLGKRLTVSGNDFTSKVIYMRVDDEQ